MKRYPVSGLRETNKHNLKQLLAELVKSQPGVEEIYLFGSRAYNTGSLRSDCDLLVRISAERLARSSDFRDFSIQQCPALDFFLCAEARATSCSNDSYVYATTFQELITKLDAVKLWTRASGFSDFSFIDSGNWVFETAHVAQFAMTSLPDEYVGEESWRQKIRIVETHGLPVRPFIGDTISKAAAQISDVARKMIFKSNDLAPRGKARSGWTVDLASEYDCQNLFFTVIKPWLPELGREEVTIRYDDQEKSADFSLFRGKLIVEMKFVDSEDKKREVVKTLSGLSNFYSRNANVGYLLFIIYVKEGVALDASKWEAEFTFMHTSPAVVTIVISVP